MDDFQGAIDWLDVLAFIVICVIALVYVGRD